MFRERVVKLVCLRTLASSVATAFGILALSSGVGALPALASESAQPSIPTPSFNAAPAWLNAAMPYVHVTNHVASIDPRLGRVLSPRDVAIVRGEVAFYNSVPFTLRTASASHPVVISVRGTRALYSACYGYISFHSWNWWGVQFYLNDCYAQGIALGVGLFAVAAILLAIIPGLNVAMAALAAMLGLASGSIMWADQHCGWNGVYLNVPWVPAFVWGSSICG